MPLSIYPLIAAASSSKEINEIESDKKIKMKVIMKCKNESGKCHSAVSCSLTLSYSVLSLSWVTQLCHLVVSLT